MEKLRHPVVQKLDITGMHWSINREDAAPRQRDYNATGCATYCGYECAAGYVLPELATITVTGLWT